MEINVRLLGVEDAARRLRNIPGGVTFVLRAAIGKALRGSRAAISREVKKEYAVPPAWLKQSIGQPRMSGPTSGFVRISGAKPKLSMFGFRDIRPYGVAVQERREGLPSQLLHAFARNAQGRIFTREHADVKRLPIREMTGLAVAEMAGLGRKQEVGIAIQKKLAADVHQELERLIRLILAGEIQPK